MDNISLEEIQVGILNAKNTTDLDKPFKNLIEWFNPVDRDGNPRIHTLSDLRIVAERLQQRIAKINELQDLGETYKSFEEQPRVKIINAFGNITHRLAVFGAYPTAVNLLIDLWNEFSCYQYSQYKDSKPFKSFYCAAIGMYLGQLGLLYGERGDAMWWLLHGYANDILCGQPKGAVHDLLKLNFGVSDRVFDYMAECKKENGNKPHALFAEHLVMQLSLKPEFANLFSYPCSYQAFPIGRAYAKSMLRRIDRKNANGSLIGQPLEEFVRYLVLLMSGWVPSKNTYHYRTGIDSDVVARYIREPEAISSSRARAILIECKNIKSTLDVAETGYFLFRMALTQVEVGILFARKNLSGDSPEVMQHQNARHLLDLAFQQNGAAVVVIDRDDLDEIANGKKTIWTLIDSGIVERRFGKSHSESN